jgi:hypothetical protein
MQTIPHHSKKFKHEYILRNSGLYITSNPSLVLPMKLDIEDQKTKQSFFSPKSRYIRISAGFNVVLFIPAILQSFFVLLKND